MGGGQETVSNIYVHQPALELLKRCQPERLHLVALRRGRLQCGRALNVKAVVWFLERKQWPVFEFVFQGHRRLLLELEFASDRGTLFSPYIYTNRHARPLLRPIRRIPFQTFPLGG